MMFYKIQDVQNEDVNEEVMVYNSLELSGNN